MPTVVINWEGRGYVKESLEADLRAASKILDFRHPLWHGCYDTGLIITDNPAEKEATSLRHGRASETVLEKEYYSSDLAITDNWLRDQHEIYEGYEDQEDLDRRVRSRKASEFQGYQVSPLNLRGGEPLYNFAGVDDHHGPPNGEDPR